MLSLPASAAFNPPAYDYGPNAVNMLPTRPYASLPASATDLPSGNAEPVLPSTVPVPSSPGDTVKAGVATVDGTWRVGASAGQYGTDVTDYTNDPTVFVGDHLRDPNMLATKKVPSYGIETRTTFRALVIQGTDGKRLAVVANNFYIAQDLVNRRVAEILRERDRNIKLGVGAGALTGINEANMSIYISHDHSSPFYSSTGWGVWAFQDVFDLRFFEYAAQKMAQAVVEASSQLRPVRMGAATIPFDYTQRHSFGPAIGFDGTPAGYPKRDNDLTISVMRFDDITDRANPRPYANWYVFGQHPEFTEGNNLLTDDWPGKVYRMLDAETGATTIFSQNNVGTSEPDRNAETHAATARAEFSHRDYAQQERGARQIANAVIKAFNSIGTAQPIAGYAYVPYQPLDFPVRILDRRYAPPYSHPYPSVSNCRTPEVVRGNPGLPLVGVPDCDNSAGALFGPVFAQLKGTPLDPGANFQQLLDFCNKTPVSGCAIPSNYGAPSYTGLEETIQVHIQVIRLGDVVVTNCPCEQWADQSRNIKSRADQVQGNEWLGWDWTQFCTQNGGPGSNWTCPNPDAVANYDRDPSSPPPGGTITITDYQERQMHAQVVNDAAGWDKLSHAATAEAEPSDPAQIKGNYTHSELPADLGYPLVITTSHVNDYWGYIATYREYQRGDHYRKALTGLGAHSSDWLVTRMVAMAAVLREGTDPGDCATVTPAADWWVQQIKYNPLDCTYMVDDSNQRARAILLGEVAAAALPAYEASMPADAGTPGAVTQPNDIQRFDRADFTWSGGDNYIDSPVVTVEREASPGQWVTQGDSFGDIQTTVKYPDNIKAETATYRKGSFTWDWTAHFEAFDSDVSTARFGKQTPSGRYRFVVDGQHRTGTKPKTYPYHVESAPFEVKPWTGITVPEISLDSNGHVVFAVGPTVTRQYNTDEYTRRPQDPSHMVNELVGPIAYPDTYQTSAYPTAPETGNSLFPRVQRNVVIDRNNGNHERYCFSCTFRPWAATGAVASASVLVHRGATTETVPATLGSDGQLHTDAVLGPGDSAEVLPGSIHDTFGETNGTGSAVVTRGAVVTTRGAF